MLSQRLFHKFKNPVQTQDFHGVNESSLNADEEFWLRTKKGYLLQNL